MATLKAEIYQQAEEEFNLNSPPQLRAILYDQLGLQPGKKTPKGELSTDASVLEKLRDEHPVVDALLQWRELDKLNSTYLEALPKLVDPRDGRVHTTFNQAVGGHGAAVLDQPQPAEHPDPQRPRSPDPPGVHPRRTRARCCWCWTTPRSSCGSWRTCRATRGCATAFASGRGHPHRDRGARVRPAARCGRPAARAVRAKMVNYGLAYGMNAWGLAQRLDIAPDEAGEIMDAYFASFPAIREYLDEPGGSGHGRGLHRDDPGATALHPRAPGGEPAAARPGAPSGAERADPGQRERRVQGGDDPRGRGAREHPELDCHMLLTVHDELVFEVPEANVEAAAELVKDRMEHAVELEVPLQADVGWGPNWSDAAPAGH